MRMKKFIYDPVEYQNHIGAEKANKDLAGAVYVETYTKDEGRFGGDKTIIVFAFYPDEINQTFGENISSTFKEKILEELVKLCSQEMRGITNQNIKDVEKILSEENDLKYCKGLQESSDTPEGLEARILYLTESIKSRKAWASDYPLELEKIKTKYQELIKTIFPETQNEK